VPLERTSFSAFLYDSSPAFSGTGERVCFRLCGLVGAQLRSEDLSAANSDLRAPRETMFLRAFVIRLSAFSVSE